MFPQQNPQDSKFSMKTLSITFITCIALVALLLQLNSQEPVRPPIPQAPVQAPDPALAINGEQQVKLANIPGLEALNPEANPAAPPAKDMNTVFYTAEEARNSPQNTLAEDVGTLYYNLTGKDVIIPKSMEELEFTLRFRGPLTYRQTLKRLIVQMETEGYTFVPFDDELVKLLPKAQGRGASAPENGVKFVHHLDDLPDSDEFVTYVMKLDNLRPEEAQRTFNAMVGPLSSGGKIAPIANASAIAITEKTSLIKYLAEIKTKIDVPSSLIGSKWVKLEYADAEQVAESVSNALNTTSNTSSTARSRNVNVNNNNRGAAAPPVPGVPASTGNNNQSRSSSQNLGGGEAVALQVIPELRNNRIFLRGSPTDVLEAEGLIKEFDAAPEERSFFKRRLKFTPVAEFMPVAADAINDTISQDSQGAGGGAANRNGGGNRSATTSNRGGGAGGAGGGGAGGGTGGLSDPSVNSAPESMRVGKTLLVANNAENSILVKGPPQSVRIVEELINELDGRPKQVMISTVFGQLTLDDEYEAGIDFVRAFPGDESRGFAAGTANGGRTTQVNIPTLTDVASIAGAAQDGGGLAVFGQIGSFLSGFLRLAEEHENFTVLSRPTVYTTNNTLAVISSGQRVAIPSQTFTNGAGANSTQTSNIEFRDVVLRLEVIPLINSDDEVTLQIYLLNDDIVGEENINGNNIPTIGTRELVTTVTVGNNETVVLGGLINESFSEGKSGVPILSSIPGVKRLFTSKEKSSDREELLIFIQPRILNDENTISDLSSDFTSRLDVAEDTYELANGNVLPSKDSLATEGVNTRAQNAPTPSAPQRVPGAAIPVAEPEPVKKRRSLFRGGLFKGLRKR